MATLRLVIEAEVPGLDGLEKVTGQVKELESSSGRMGDVATGAFERIGHRVTDFGIGLAKAGISAGIEAIGTSVELASNKAEAASKVNVLYGDSADRIVEASEGAATAVGMSSGAYLESAGNLGNLITNLGITGSEAADMSVDMLQLAADVGSFNNADPTEVVEAMGAAFRGESEPIRRFGVMLDEASIKAKALELGLYSGTGQLDKTAKATATYQLILEQTASAQGDFARTSDGLANSQRIANARIEEAMTSLGEHLVPIVAELVPLIADGLVAAIEFATDLFEDLSPVIDEVVGVLRFLVDAIATTVDVLHDLHRAIDPNMAALEDVQTEFYATAEAAGLSGDEIEEAWEAAQASAREGGAAVTASMDEWIAAYEAGSIAADGTAQATEATADRVVANATRIAGAADATAEAFETAGERIPAAVALVAEEANMAEALRDTAVNDMPDAARDIAASIRVELTSARVAGEAEEAARSIGEAVPEEIADGMIAKSREVLDAGDRLIDLLKNGLTPEEQAMRLIGERYTNAVAKGIRSEIPGARDAALQLAVEAINTVEDAGLTGARGRRGMEAIGRYYDQLLAGGMTAAEARVALAAGGVAEATINRLEGAENAIERAGSNVGAAWVDGIAARLRSPATQTTINRAINIATRAMHGESPPKVGPLREIDEWGANIGEAWVGGFVDSIGRVAPLLTGAFNPLVDAAPSVGAVSSGPPAGSTYYVTVQTGVGDPVAIGREVVDVIGSYERANGRDWRSS